MRGINFDPKDPRILTYIRFDSSDNKWACVECDAKYRCVETFSILFLLFFFVVSEVQLSLKERS